MVWVRSPVYFYKRNDTFYFSRAVPSDLRHRFNKKKVEVSLRTKAEAKASKSAAALSDRLERYWDSLRMEMIYSRELGISVVSDKPSSGASNDIRINEALVLYHRLKGAGKTKLFFEGSDGLRTHSASTINLKKTVDLCTILQLTEIVFVTLFVPICMSVSVGFCRKKG